MSNVDASVSIIVRTKNEERWIGHCLDMVFSQEGVTFEVILVDNISTDDTLVIASRYPLKATVNIDHYTPGRAINEGIRKSVGKFIVILSGHCIPSDSSWLRKLILPLIEDPMLAGGYGRQVPMGCTRPEDRRDLINTFGLDKRIQVKDYFFHNACSVIRRDIWEKTAFDEDVTNLEDRVWAKQIVNRGYRLYYEPSAVVFHHHGLHHGNNAERLRGVVAILDRVTAEDLDEFPECMRPQNTKTIAIIPVKDSELGDPAVQANVSEIFTVLTQSKYISNAYIVSSSPIGIAAPKNGLWINKKDLGITDEMDLEEVLELTYRLVLPTLASCDLVLYASPKVGGRPADLFDTLIYEIQYSASDVVFSAYEDFGHYWYESGDGSYVQVDSSLENRAKRSPIYNARYGLGTVVRPKNITRRKLIAGTIGILPVESS